MEEKKYVIEIATTDFTTTAMAVAGGAHRIELCAALNEGGTTPGYGTIKKCRELFNVQLFSMIRPRSGDFLYKDEEYEIMLDDMLVCKNFGCDGIVTGMLERDGTINRRRTEKIIEAAYPMEVTFHRAFDRCINPFEALETLIQIGCQRILTSGQKPTATEGIDLISALVKQAAGRIVIMPGSGVRKENIKQLAVATGAEEFHASLRNKNESTMDFIHPAFKDSAESYINPAIRSQDVSELIQALAN